MTSVEQSLTNGYHNNHSTKSPNNVQTKVIKVVSDETPATIETNSEFLNGPDQILPATSYTTCDPEGRVKLRIGKKGVAAEDPISVPGMLARTTARYPDAFAYAVRENKGTWKKTTYKDYHRLVRTCAKGFIKLGLQRHHSVGILGFNSPEWFISDLAAIFAGGMAAGIYTTNNPEACYHVLSNSNANIVVVEDDKQMKKIHEIWHRLPKLKAAIQWSGQITEPNEKIFTFEQVMSYGEAESDAKLNERLKSIAINECCTLVYTSGTVGNPKAVMLSHDNMLWDVMTVSERLQLDVSNERIVSYLPLSHVAAQIVDIHTTIYNAVCVYFADKDALKGSLVNTLTEAEPTRFLGVPRVWEKIHEKMTAIGAANGAIKKSIASWAKESALAYHMKKINGINSTSYSYLLARWLIFGKIKQAIGLSKCRLMATAAAPLSADVKKYFLSIDIPIQEVYGMSEASGAHTLCMNDLFNLECQGLLLDGTETKIDNKDSKTGEGEICMRGRHIFMGYLGEKKKTEETLDEEGWLHSGDVGKVDEMNFLYITGRIKELLITAGGENVAPVPIEQCVKAELPCISQAVVIGDKRKFLSILLSFKSEANQETGEPLDNLSSDSIRWLTSIGSSAKSVKEILSGPNENIMAAIQAGINKANTHAISNAQKIQKFAILPRDLSMFHGELGPTLKIKRNVVMERFANIIESLYK